MSPQLGYKKEKVPKRTFEQLMAWYEVALPRRPLERETWKADNTYVNHWKLDTYMLHATRGVREVGIEAALPVWLSFSAATVLSALASGCVLRRWS